MIRKIQIGVVFLLMGIYIKFFDARFINETLLRYLLFLTLIIVVAISIPYIAPKNRGFVFPVQLLLGAVLLSVLMANLYWDQNLLDGLIATAPYLILLFFFFLLRIRFPIKTLEKIMVIYGVIYILLYFFEFMHSPTIYFGKSLWGDTFTESRGITRIIFPGGGLFIVSTFIALNKLTSQKKHRWFWLILTVLGLVIPVMQVTRQFILGIFLIYVYHSIRTLTLTKKTLILGAFIALAFALPYIHHPIIEGLLESTQRDASLGSNYIRVLAGEYFMFDFSPNMMTQIFGNGVPYFGESNYAFFVTMLGETQEYFLSDVGIITVYAMFGIPAILGFIIIWVKSFTIPLPKEYRYLKYYLWFVLFTSFTWYTTYHYHYLLVTVFVLYMYQSVYEKERLKSKNPDPHHAQ